MINILAAAVIIALLTLFLIIVFDKFKILSYLANKSRFLSKLVECDFCLSFWLSIPISALFWYLTRSNEYILMPFMVAPIIYLFNIYKN